jgi:hypothetical protein
MSNKLVLSTFVLVTVLIVAGFISADTAQAKTPILPYQAILYTPEPRAGLATTKPAGPVPVQYSPLLTSTIFLPYIVKNHPPIFDFEGSCEGWGIQPLNGPVQPGQGVTPTTEAAYHGRYSCRFDNLGPYSLPDGTSQDVGIAYDSYKQRVTAHVYLPSGAPSIPVVIYKQDCADSWKQDTAVNLVPGVWRTVVFNNPDDGCPPYKRVGLHFTPGSYTGPVYIDYVVLEYY